MVYIEIPAFSDILEFQVFNGNPKEIWILDRISSFFMVGRRVWVNCSPSWNDIFAPGFFVVQGIDQ